jgi:hypothetical protein
MELAKSLQAKANLQAAQAAQESDDDDDGGWCCRLSTLGPYVARGRAFEDCAGWSYVFRCMKAWPGLDAPSFIVLAWPRVFADGKSGMTKAQKKRLRKKLRDTAAAGGKWA